MRRTVQSERTGLRTGAFAICGVRAAFATRGCVRGGLSGHRERIQGPESVINARQCGYFSEAIIAFRLIKTSL